MNVTKEFAPGDIVVSRYPVFSDDNGRLEVRLSTKRVRMGYQAVGEEMDERTVHAMDALDEVLEDPALGKSFEFLPGQIQIINNRKLGHRRTACEDWPDAERRRHLVRIWVRNKGTAFLRRLTDQLFGYMLASASSLSA